MNLASLILSHAAARPSHPAMVEKDVTIDYAEAAARMLRYAGHLCALGLRAGDRVGLCLRDTADHLVLHYAVAALGAVMVPVDHRWTPAEKGAVASAFRCRLVVTEADDPAAAEMPAASFEAAAWRAAAPVAAELPADEAAPLLISLSSGTTGRPTGAVVSHRQLYERFISQWAGIGLNGGDRFLLATPLYFGGGRSFAMSSLASGGTLIFCPPPARAPEVIETARAQRATAGFVVPTQVTRMLEEWKGEGPAMPLMRRLITSGAAMHPAQRLQALERLSPGLTDYYATSEGGGIAVLHAEEQRAFPETVGRPAFRVEIGIVDAAGTPLPVGEVGRLRYRGPGVSSALVGEDGGIVPADPQGWFMPGDLAKLLPSGHVQLVGRAKDVIIRAGVNIYPAEIEAALLACPGVAEAAVFPLPDPELGEVVVAALVPSPGVAVEEEAVRAVLRARLAPYKQPQRLLVVPALPRNAGGKVVRAALPALAGAGG
jgi:acyl-CoA synthetase (AMP-forming)/AMP-acid ligase II